MNQPNKPNPSKEHDYKLYEYYEQPTGKWWPCNMDISAFKMQGIEIRLINPDSLHVGETVEENTSIQHLPHVQEAADNYYNIIHSKHA